MDNKTNENEHQIPALAFSENAISFLKTGASWAKFIAIIGFIFVGLIAFGGLIFGVAFSFIGNDFMPTSFPIGLLGFAFLLIAAVYFFPVFYLYRFSTQAHNAVISLNSNNLELSMLNLKSYFKFIGILIIVMLALYAIGIITMIVGFSFLQDQILQMG